MSDGSHRESPASLLAAIGRASTHWPDDPVEQARQAVALLGADHPRVQLLPELLAVIDATRAELARYRQYFALPDEADEESE